MPYTCLSYSEQLTADKLSLNVGVAASGYTACVHTMCEVAAGYMNFLAQRSFEPSERGVLPGTVRVVLV
jgi:hypothetical protein